MTIILFWVSLALTVIGAVLLLATRFNVHPAVGNGVALLGDLGIFTVSVVDEWELWTRVFFALGAVVTVALVLNSLGLFGEKFQAEA